MAQFYIHPWILFSDDSLSLYYFTYDYCDRKISAKKQSCPKIHCIMTKLVNHSPSRRNFFTSFMDFTAGLPIFHTDKVSLQKRLCCLLPVPSTVSSGTVCFFIFLSELSVCLQSCSHEASDLYLKWITLTLISFQFKVSTPVLTTHCLRIKGSSCSFQFNLYLRTFQLLYPLYNLHEGFSLNRKPQYFIILSSPLHKTTANGRNFFIFQLLFSLKLGNYP